jgi:hypothetical protein
VYELSLLLYRISDVNTSIDGVTAHATGAAHGTVQGNAIFIPRSPGRSRNRRHPSLEDVPHTMVVGIGYNDGAAGQYGDSRRPRYLCLVLRSVAVAADTAYERVSSAVALGT